MPYASEEDRKKNARQRYEKIRSDPTALEARREKNRAYYRERMTDPEFRERKRAATKVQKKSNPERVKKTQRESKLRRLYGVEPNDYRRMLEEQGGTCAICHRSSKSRLVVDHDHRSGQVRGLLCDSCNQGIGKLRDDVSILESAIEYLRRVRPQMIGAA